MPDDVPHWPCDVPHRHFPRSGCARPGGPVRLCGIQSARLREPFPREQHVDEDEHSGGYTWTTRPPELVGEGAENGTDAHAEARRGRQPAQCACTLRGRHGVSDVRLCYPGRSSAESLYDAAHEQQPEGIGKPEYQVGDPRSNETDDEHWSTSVPIGHAAPNWRRKQLCDCKRAEQRTNDAGLTA